MIQMTPSLREGFWDVMHSILTVAIPLKFDHIQELHPSLSKSIGPCPTAFVPSMPSSSNDSGTRLSYLLQGTPSISLGETSDPASTLPDDQSVPSNFGRSYMSWVRPACLFRLIHSLHIFQICQRFALHSQAFPGVILIFNPDFLNALPSTRMYSSSPLTS